ncbi:EscU/YscU/HrcU family type III secretion system export apparatus switch protein [Evansella sp. LMS18]|uniref:EscU/YscU/HrcU family type III secretion system export apparatus switch protein n=1 Tax=Evansella sp. LMS18 TaxID=2924033 RepID=UPI0020D1D9FA|nr:EscU/YscU/HrcU family type III secretion system export apparatus switch protein [Evansella sp. LMS18]UTR10882.1 EscU/YscU/HrcU family type III secretion system export apparatus switch protein [Evansella sp. LMS18]
MKKNHLRRQRAVALKYNQELHGAPAVAAKGSGYVAENILKAAKENNIPVQEDPALVEMLSQLNINEEIPPALYEVTAEIFAFIYRLDNSQESDEAGDT